MRIYKMFARGTYSGESEPSSYGIGVPKSIGRELGTGAQFQLEITDDGLLYRYLGVSEGHTVDVPDWAHK